MQGIPLSHDQCSKTPNEKVHMQTVPYVFVEGSLMYAMLYTRLDICFAIYMVSRYQSNPGSKHWKIIKHILKYFKRMRDYMLVFQSDELVPKGS